MSRTRNVSPCDRNGLRGCGRCWQSWMPCSANCWRCASRRDSVHRRSRQSSAKVRQPSKSNSLVLSRASRSSIMSDNSPETEKNALITRYADLLNAQADADELQLIDDLETVYASARVPERLIAEGLRGLEKPGRPQGAEKPGRPQGSPLPYTKVPAGVGGGRSRRWVTRFNALAAVLIAALLVGSLLVVTHMARRPQQGNGNGNTNASQCAIPQSHKITAWLSSLYMMNVTTGWALGVDHITGLNRILHTTDGGTTWQGVTPQQREFTSTVPSQKTTYAGSPYFLNGCSAWIAVIQPDNAPALLFRTGNGGLTWQQTTLPGSQIRGIDFIDAHTGWLMVDMLENGKFTEEDFYHSVDGGQHWTKIAVSSPQTDNQPGALPFANADNNLTFINANTGWITGFLSINNNPRLYITHDGGRTWHQQILSPDNGDSRIFKSGTVVWQPQFFSASEGILPLSFWAASSFDVYVTHDGGNSWQSTSLLRIPTPPNLDIAAPMPDPDFVDVNHGWASGWQGMPLYATSDGGRHWTKIVPQPNVPYMALLNYDFVTDRIGWAIRVFTGTSVTSVRPSLYKTEDGGKTWTYIRG